MYERRRLNGHDYITGLEAVFMHRPFRRMPENGWGMAYLFSLVDQHQGELRAYAEAAGVNFDELLAEMHNRPHLSDYSVQERICEEVFPLVNTVLRAFRQEPAYAQVVTGKMQLGADTMQELGNLYTGALPAWFAAGLEEAARVGVDLAGKEVLLFGYGSGDAAEAIPVTLVPGWEAAAQKIGMAKALDNAIDLDVAQYTALHSGSRIEVSYRPHGEFVIERVGAETAGGFQDKGIEYYRYVD